jgi:hypothetical protein
MRRGSEQGSEFAPTRPATRTIRPRSRSGSDRLPTRSRSFARHAPPRPSAARQASCRRDSLRRRAERNGCARGRAGRRGHVEGRHPASKTLRTSSGFFR